jgi:hypothetical protein
MSEQITHLIAMEQRLDALLYAKNPQTFVEGNPFLQCDGQEPINLTPGVTFDTLDGFTGYVMCYLDKKQLYIIGLKTPSNVLSWWNSTSDAPSEYFFRMSKCEDITNLPKSSIKNFDPNSKEFKLCVQHFMETYNK